MTSFWNGEMCVGKRRMHVLSYCLLMRPTCISFAVCVCTLTSVHIRETFICLSVCSCMNLCVCTPTCVSPSLPLKSLWTNWVKRIKNKEDWCWKKGRRSSLQLCMFSTQMTLSGLQLIKAYRGRVLFFGSFCQTPQHKLRGSLFPRILNIQTLATPTLSAPL